MTTLYTIRDWDKHFETAQSRKCKVLSWVSIPNKHDGKGYRRLMRRENGPAIYAAWILMVQVASKCPTRGVLADGDGPLTPEDLETKTDCPAEIFAAALKVLVTPEIRWIEARDCEDDGSTILAASTTLPIHHKPTSHHKQNKQVDIDSDQKNSSTDSIPTSDRSRVLHVATKIADRTGMASPKDQAFILKVATLVASGQLAEGVVMDAAEGVRIKRPRKPLAYFTTSLHNGIGPTKQAGKEKLGAMLASVRVPEAPKARSP